MQYKMSEVVAETKVPKSTILYYIREGLLPEATKLKSNVHRYSQEHIELIKYIRYMQEEIGSSNEKIRYAIQNKNQSFSSSFSMLEPLMNTLSAIDSSTEHFTKQAFIETFKIDKSLLEQLLKDGIILPTNDNDYTQKEASIITLVQEFQDAGISYEILKAYVHHAKALSELELTMQTQLCDLRSDSNFSTLWKIMFETLLSTKEYILKRHTYKAMLQALKKELLQ